MQTVCSGAQLYPAGLSMSSFLRNRNALADTLHEYDNGNVLSGFNETGERGYSMKKLSVMILTALLLFTMTGCGDNADTKPSDAPKTESNEHFEGHLLKL